MKFRIWMSTGVKTLLAVLAITVGLAAQGVPTYTVLYAFTGGADGGDTVGGLGRDRAGNLYGAAADGGVTTGCEFGSEGCGVVFKVDSAGQESVLYSFLGLPDGELPFAGLVRDQEGNFYGTTRYGGPSDVGTVFKVDPTGKETVLYSFTGGTDGANPFAGLILDPAGNLYGTTPYGGDLSCALEGPYGCGVVFKLDPTGQETVLHSFAGTGDGGFPEAGLVRDKEGNLYGTAPIGGLATCPFAPYCGVVFKLDLTGNETVLYSFTGPLDGLSSSTGLVRDAEGNLYGVAGGGDLGGFCEGFFGCGLVFKVDPTGKESVLYTFTGGADGANPGAGLIRDREGNLYGTTGAGGDLSACIGFYGPEGCGVVFEVDPTGKESVIYSFTGGAGGSGPRGLVRDAQGNLYGITGAGGDLSACNGAGCGLVFKLKP